MRATTIRRATRVGPRGARLGFLGAAAVALAVAVALVWHGAYAGFSAGTTPRTLPTVSTGQVALTDSDAGTALFSATGLKPGSTGSRCITVTAQGTVPAAVRMYAGGVSSTTTLSSYLTLTVQPGSGGNAGCNGFSPSGTAATSTLAAFPTSWSTGLVSWQTTGAAGEARAYKITYTLSASAPDSAQGGTAKANFVWEARTP